MKPLLAAHGVNVGARTRVIAQTRAAGIWGGGIYTLAAVREDGGRWRITRIDKAPSLPGATHRLDPKPRAAWGYLTATDGAALDKAMKSRCLFLGPTATKEQTFRTCFDASMTFVEIASGKRLWRADYYCGLRGLSGPIIERLWAAAPKPPEPFTAPEAIQR